MRCAFRNEQKNVVQITACAGSTVEGCPDVGDALDGGREESCRRKERTGAELTPSLGRGSPMAHPLQIIWCRGSHHAAR